MNVFGLSAVSLRTRFVTGMGFALVPLMFVGVGATVALERSLDHLNAVVEEASEEVAVFLRLQVLLERASTAMRNCASPGVATDGACDDLRLSLKTVSAAFEGAASAPFALAQERALLDSARQHWQRAGDIGETILVVSDPRRFRSGEFAEADAQIDRAVTLLEQAHRLGEWEMASSLTSVQGTRRRTLLLIVSMFALGVSIAVAGATILARSILTPIHALEFGATQFAAGNLEYRVVPSECAELARLGGTFNAMAEALARSQAALMNASVRDGLTDVYNHREFKRCLTAEIQRWCRTGEMFDVLLLDIDRFKSINDSWGHQTGDEVLRRVAARLSQAVRPTDVVARTGGDEFAILLPRTSPDGAVAIAERVRSLVATATTTGTMTLPEVTASIGIASCPEDAESDEILIGKADSALYEAKRAGGNRARAASDGFRQST